MRNLLLIITIILFGISFFFRKLSVDRIHPYQLQIVAGAVYALEVPIWLYILNKNNVTGYDPTGVVFAVLCILCHVIAAVIFGVLLKGSNNTGALTALVAINPMVTFFLSMVFLGEALTLKKIIACGLALAGLVLFSI